jgi:DNA mismatch repair protein MSH4
MQSYSDNTTRPWTGQSHSASIARPRTAQSHPGTAQATTPANSRYEASFIIALLEGRGISREVGIAALDRDTGRVMLIQVSCLYTLWPTRLTTKMYCSLLTARHT